MTTRISRELSLFNLKRPDMWCAWIGHLSDKLWPFEFLENFRCSTSIVSIYYEPESDLRGKSYKHLNFSRAFVVQFRASRYNTRLNRTCEWKVMIIWISRELSMINFERLDMWCAWIGHPSDKLWTYEFLESFCSILSVSLCYAPKSNFCGKSYDHLNLSSPYVVQFQASWYIMRLNRTSVW